MESSSTMAHSYRPKTSDTRSPLSSPTPPATVRHPPRISLPPEPHVQLRRGERTVTSTLLSSIAESSARPSPFDPWPSGPDGSPRHTERANETLALRQPVHRYPDPNWWPPQPESIDDAPVLPPPPRFPPTDPERWEQRSVSTPSPDPRSAELQAILALQRGIGKLFEEQRTFFKELEDRKSQRDELAGLFFFGGLFAGVITTFLIDGRQSLQDPTLNGNSSFTQHNANAINSSLLHLALVTPKPSSSSASGSGYTLVYVNVLWYTSLVLVLTSGLTAARVKDHLRRDRLQPRDKRGKNWDPSGLIPAIEGAFHLAFFLFLFGLAAFIRAGHPSIATPIFAVGGIILGLYIFIWLEWFPLFPGKSIFWRLVHWVRDFKLSLSKRGRDDSSDLPLSYDQEALLRKIGPETQRRMVYRTIRKVAHSIGLPEGPPLANVSTYWGPGVQREIQNTQLLVYAISRLGANDGEIHGVAIARPSLMETLLFCLDLSIEGVGSAYFPSQASFASECLSAINTVARAAYASNTHATLELLFEAVKVRLAAHDNPLSEAHTLQLASDTLELICGKDSVHRFESKIDAVAQLYFERFARNLKVLPIGTFVRTCNAMTPQAPTLLSQSLKAGCEAFAEVLRLIHKDVRKGSKRGDPPHDHPDLLLVLNSLIGMLYGIHQTNRPPECQNVSEAIEAIFDERFVRSLARPDFHCLHRIAKSMLTLIRAIAMQAGPNSGTHSTSNGNSPTILKFALSIFLLGTVQKDKALITELARTLVALRSLQEAASLRKTSCWVALQWFVIPELERLISPKTNPDEQHDPVCGVQPCLEAIRHSLDHSNADRTRLLLQKVHRWAELVRHRHIHNHRSRHRTDDPSRDDDEVILNHLTSFGYDLQRGLMT